MRDGVGGLKNYKFHIFHLRPHHLTSTALTMNRTLKNDVFSEKYTLHFWMIELENFIVIHYITIQGPHTENIGPPS